MFTKDRNLLIILDTCRADVPRTVADEDDFLDDIGTLESVGARSPEWIARTFTHEYADEIELTMI